MSDARKLETFFKIALGRTEGYLCIATMSPGKRGMHEEYFSWPDQLQDILQHVETYAPTHNVYWCPQLFDTRRRKKENIRSCPSAWSDLDACPPEKLLVEPSLIVESSPGRFQAVWSFEEPQDPGVAESLSRRIAYFHAHQGADTSGWDLTQLLRVPYTQNFKYEPPAAITTRRVSSARYRLTEFEEYPEVKGSALLSLPVPEQGDLPQQDAEAIMELYRRRSPANLFHMWQDEPLADWSKALWRMMMACFESGMSREEVYKVCLTARCNKYVRDGKPPEFLWRDVCRAYQKNEENNNTVVTPSELDDLLTPEEIAYAEAQETFVERYSRWAEGLGDAAPQYHPAAAFIILSSLLAGRVVLPTSFGTVLPNLWFMILADTTLTRKSTAMDIGMDLLAEVDEDAVLATDGSIEGLFGSLQGRPGRPSVFLRDEFSGLLEQITKKDYYAGMAETLTKLYDGKLQKRVLRKETITISKPVLILFAGGIKNKVQSLLSFEHVSSGFIPRFVFVTAESNVMRMQPLGPPTQKDLSGRQAILDEMVEMFEHYNVPEQTGKGIRLTQSYKTFQAALTPGAWARYNQFEKDMLAGGVQAERQELMTPLYDRLAKSTLKAAVLLAAAEQRESEVLVTEATLIQAINYARQWRDYANEVVNGIGKNSMEKELDLILHAILRNPGISRSRLMQNYHLTARNADAIFSTLEQRGTITSSRVGRGTLYYPDVGATQ